MHPFRKYILDYNFINKEEWAQIEKCLVKKVYEKGDLILTSGKICRKLYFLEDGFLRYYILNEGREVSKFFTEPPYCFTSQKSFTSNIPAEENIEVLKKSTVWEMNKSDAFGLLKIYNWSEFVRKLVQEVQYKTEQILIETQTKTAEERYFKMVRENDILLSEVSLKYIASYLGIAPQSLSRIRKKYWAESKLT